MNEADTCQTYVLPKLKSAGWEDKTIPEQIALLRAWMVAYLDGLYPIGHLRQAKVNALREVQSAGGEELSAFILSVLNRAFKGEL